MRCCEVRGKPYGTGLRLVVPKEGPITWVGGFQEGFQEGGRLSRPQGLALRVGTTGGHSCRRPGQALVAVEGQRGKGWAARGIPWSSFQNLDNNILMVLLSTEQNLHCIFILIFCPF